MAKLPDIIRYEGTNEELFKRITVDRKLKKGAMVIVPDTHSAVLVKDGQMMDTLDSGKYPIYDAKKGLFKDKKGSIALDVIYVSKTAKLKMMWGTRTQLDARDPVTDIALKIGASGEVELQVGNPRKFYLELVGSDRSYDLDALKERIIGKMLNEFEPALAKTMKEKNLSYDRLGEFKKDIADGIMPALSDLFLKEYGVKVFSFIISTVLISEADRKAIEDERAVLRKSKRFEANLEIPEPAEAPKPENLICPDCKKSNPAGSKFCIACGKKL